MMMRYVIIYHTIMRTIIDLPEYQIDALRLLEERKNVSRAELIRQAVAQYVVRNVEAPEAFGAWKSKTPTLKKAMDGVAVQKKLRAEWDR
jgi:Ribbon-helix-helix protein, copG family